jgi:hypothetical protein
MDSFDDDGEEVGASRLASRFVNMGTCIHRERSCCVFHSYSRYLLLFILDPGSYEEKKTKPVFVDPI